MTPPMAGCPSGWALERYLLGELPPDRAEVARHIDHCPACQGKLAARRADGAQYLRSPEAAQLRELLGDGQSAPALGLGGPGPFIVRHRRHALLVAAAAAAAAAAVAVAWDLSRPPTADEERAVLRLGNEWMDAIRTRDAAALDRILDDRFTLTDHRGKVTTKADSLRGAKTGADHLESFDMGEAKVRFYGDTAVVTGRARVAGRNAAGSYDAEIQFTDIFARVDGRWRVVAAHVSIPERGR